MKEPLTSNDFLEILKGFIPELRTGGYKRIVITMEPDSFLTFDIIKEVMTDEGPFQTVDFSKSYMLVSVDGNTELKE